MKHYMRLNKKTQNNQRNDPKNTTKIGSSHHYTQRQLALERKKHSLALKRKKCSHTSAQNKEYFTKTGGQSNHS